MTVSMLRNIKEKHELKWPPTQMSKLKADYVQLLTSNLDQNGRLPIPPPPPVISDFDKINKTLLENSFYEYRGEVLVMAKGSHNEDKVIKILPCWLEKNGTLNIMLSRINLVKLYFENSVMMT